jgi:hypothetical protein
MKDRRAYMRRWYRRNIARVRAYRAANKKKITEYASRYFPKYYEKNKRRIRGSVRRYYRAHRHKKLAYQAKYAASHSAQIKGYNALRYSRNSSRVKLSVRRRFRASRDTLGDAYIRHLITNGDYSRAFPARLIPPTLVELKRAHLQLKRALKTNQ